MKGKTALITLLILAFTAPLFSADKMRIAILDMKEDGVSRRIARVASNMIRNEFINLRKYTVVERNQMNLIMKEQGFQKSGCTDQECAVQLGRLMAARKILVGEVSELGKSLILTVRIVDVEKGISEFAAKEKAGYIDQLDSATTRLVQKLSARINGGSFTPRKEEPEKEDKGPRVRSSTAYYLWGIIPGAGQIYAGSTVKGVVIMSSFAAAGGAFGWGIINYNSQKDDYNDLPAGTSQDEFDRRFDEYQKAGTINIIFASLLGAVYIYNWIDLIFITDFKPGPVLAKMPRKQFFYTCTVYDRTLGLKDDRRYEVVVGMRF